MAKKAVQDSDLPVKQFWDTLSDGICLTDEQGYILAVNESFSQIVKMNIEALVNQPFPIIYRADERAEALEIYIQDLFNNSIQPKYEVERTLWDNQKIWLEFSNTVINCPGSSKKQIFSIIRDISVKKKKEADLNRRYDYVNQFFKDIPDTVFIAHLLDSHKFGNFVEINESASNQLLYTSEQAKELNLYNISPPKYNEYLSEVISVLLRKKQIVFEIDLISRDRRIIPFEMNAHLTVIDSQRTIVLVGRDITGRKRAEEKITSSREQLRNLASRLQTIREEERKMIAREIHDELGQLLTVLKIQIALIAGKLPADNKDIQKKIKSAVIFIDQAVDSVQKISAKLRPGILDELGLIPAIEWQAQEFQERTGITCYCSTFREPIELEPERSTALFRILQEALTNVARHSTAKKVSIYLQRANNHLILEITDNGVGIRDAQISSPKSLGLMGIKERAMVFGGKVTIHGVPDEGTNLKIEMPIPIK